MSQPEVYLFKSYSHISRSLTRASYFKYSKAAYFKNPKLLTDTKFNTFGINHIHESGGGQEYVVAAEEGFGEISLPSCNFNWVENKLQFEQGKTPVLKESLPKFYQVVKYKDLYICASPLYLDWMYYLGPVNVTKRVFNRPFKLANKPDRTGVPFWYGRRQIEEREAKKEIKLTPPESRSTDFKIYCDRLYYIAAGDQELRCVNLAKLYDHVVKGSDKSLQEKDYPLPQTVVDRGVSIFHILKDGRLLYIKKGVLLDKDDEDFEMKTASASSHSDMKVHKNQLFLLTNGSSHLNSFMYRISVYCLKEQIALDSMEYGVRFKPDERTPYTREKVCPNRLHLFMNRQLLHGLVVYQGLFLAVFSFAFGRLANVGRVKPIFKLIPDLRGILQSSINPNKMYLYDLNSIYGFRLQL